MLPARRSRRLVVALALAGAVALTTGATSGTFGAFSATTANPGNAFSSAPDWTAPTASAAVIAKDVPAYGPGHIPGFVRPGGAYRVYASVSDAGNPPSGTAGVTADVRNVTTTQATPVALAAGAVTVGGVAYSHRSAAVTANAAAGSTPAWSLSATDAAGNARTQTGFAVTVDATAPSATDVQITNGSGGTVGKPEAGDVVTFAFSEELEPYSVLNGWTGAATSVVVRINQTGNPATFDLLTVHDATNATQLPLGTVDLQTKGYVSATVSFGATGTPSTMTKSGNVVTVKLGTPSGATSIPGSPKNLAWTPSTATADRAGNPVGATTANEAAPLDVDF